MNADYIWLYSAFSKPSMGTSPRRRVPARQSAAARERRIAQTQAKRERRMARNVALLEQQL